MRIGFIHSTGFPSLDANVVQVVQMCRAFSGLGHEVTLFIPRADGLTCDEAAITQAQELFGGELPFRIVFVPRVRILGRLEVLGSVRGTLRTLRQLPLDLIYTRNPWSVLFLPRVGIPFVFEAHEEHVHDRSPFLDRLLRRMIVRQSRKTSCRLVVTISEALRRIWQGYGVPQQKLLAAHDGVDAENFLPDLSPEEAREQLRPQYPHAFTALPVLHCAHPPSPGGHACVKSRPLVVYAGAMKEDRGIDLILQAAQAVEHCDFVLVGGKDAEVAKWQSEAERLGVRNVRFTGRVPHKEIPLWLAAADILLMMWTWKVPTIRGCSPLKLFEYMAAGRLIVGPAFPTVCEVVEDGKDAILFEPDNLKRMIAALKRAAAQLDDDSLPASARAKVSREYTWSERARKIVDTIFPPSLSGGN